MLLCGNCSYKNGFNLKTVPILWLLLFIFGYHFYSIFSALSLFRFWLHIQLCNFHLNLCIVYFFEIPYLCIKTIFLFNACIFNSLKIFIIKKKNIIAAQCLSALSLGLFGVHFLLPAFLLWVWVTFSCFFAYLIIFYWKLDMMVNMFQWLIFCYCCSGKELTLLDSNYSFFVLMESSS